MAGDGTTEAQHCRPACDKVTKRGGHWRSGQGQGGRFGEGLAPCEGLGLYPVRGSLVSPGQPLASVGGGGGSGNAGSCRPRDKGPGPAGLWASPDGTEWLCVDRGKAAASRGPRDPGGVSPGPTMAGLFTSGSNPFPTLFPAVSL